MYLVDVELEELEELADFTNHVRGETLDAEDIDKILRGEGFSPGPQGGPSGPQGGDQSGQGVSVAA